MTARRNIRSINNLSTLCRLPLKCIGLNIVYKTHHYHFSVRWFLCYAYVLFIFSVAFFSFHRYVTNYCVCVYLCMIIGIAKASHQLCTNYDKSMYLCHVMSIILVVVIMSNLWIVIGKFNSRHEFGENQIKELNCYGI